MISRARALLSLPALVASVGVHSVAYGQAPAPVTIRVDATQPGAPLERVWAYYGYDEPNYTTTAEGEDLLRTLVEANAAPIHVRTHFLFNTGDGTPTLKWGSTNLYTEDEAGNPIYSYTLIDQIMDSTLEAGAFPLVELGFMPQALSIQPEPYQNRGTYTLDSGSFYPPKDYGKWAELIETWAAHVKERYPDAETKWQWELWNEPDITYWHGTFDEYAKLYDYTESALHAVFPDAVLGGPAVTNPNNDFLRPFLEHCKSGTNAVTGEPGTRLDMVTFHAKGGVRLSEDDEHVQMNLGNQLALHRTGFEAVIDSGVFADRPIVITEADPDGCAACLFSVWREYAYRVSPAYGAYVVAMMKRSIDLADEMDVNLDGVLTWAFTFPGSPYFAGYRALATNGIHLPVLNAFKLLGRMSGARLPVTSTGAHSLGQILESSVREAPDVDSLATLEDGRIEVLVWNYHDDLVPSEATPVTLRISLPPGFRSPISLAHSRVDEDHGNAHALWQAQGSPDPPSADEIAQLLEVMHPVVLDERKLEAQRDGSVTLSFDLPRFGISRVTLEQAPEPPSVMRPKSGTLCSLRSPASGKPPDFAWWAVALALLRRRR